MYDDLVEGITILVTDRDALSTKEPPFFFLIICFPLSSGNMGPMEREDLLASQKYPYDVDYDSLDRAREDDLDFHSLSDFLNEMVIVCVCVRVCVCVCVCVCE
jgi:hypothetical protein